MAAAARKKCQVLRELYEGKGEVGESGFLLYLGLGTKKSYRAVSTPKHGSTRAPDSTWGETLVEMYTQHGLVQGATSVFQL